MTCCGVPILSDDKVIRTVEVEHDVPTGDSGIISRYTMYPTIQPDLVSVRDGMFGAGSHD